MAKYKVTKLCFINGKRSKAGDTVEFEGKAPSYLEAVKVDKPKAKAKKED